MRLNFGQAEEYQGVLLYSDSTSLFSYKAISQNEHEDIKNEDITEVSFSIQDTTTLSIWSNKSTGEVYETVKIAKTHKLIVEPLDTIAWEISSETKNISNYTCYKGTCRYRGRNYIAWFTPDVACTWGPWKLQGLPGAILEAYDDRNEVSFYATGIMNKDTLITSPVKQYETISNKEYLSQMQEIAVNMSKRLGSRVGREFKVSIATPKIYGIEIADEE